MSDISITIEEIGKIEHHPNADELDIATILGAKTIIRCGQFREGMKVVYFPPDMLLPPKVADQLGVRKYLKHSLWEGEKTQCRIAACRLRGIPSFGFATEVPPEMAHLPAGSDVTEHYEARKYEPPVVLRRGGDVRPELPNFPQYTSSQHLWKHPHAIPIGTPVRITEKIHGTNSRVGLIRIPIGNGDFQFVAGSHRVRLDPDGPDTIYWYPLGLTRVLSMMTSLCDEKHDVILYGEIYGPGIQDMDYGITEGLGYRVFDITVDGRYLDWADVRDICQLFGVWTVPCLYEGPFSPEIVEHYTDGSTTAAIGEVRSKFKGREGVVVTPLKESFTPVLGGRTIVKSVSADYLDRKGAKDNG
jgi:RNA ligase (TIGR02306 family)